MFIDPKEAQNGNQDVGNLRTPLFQNKNVEEFFLLIRDIILIVILVLIIRSVLITPFRINGSSMEPSYHSGEYILVDKLSYFDPRNTFSYTDHTYTGIEKMLADAVTNTLGKIPLHMGDPKRGDAVVIMPGVSAEKEYYIKRVIGLPGDTIRIASGQVFIQVESTGAFIPLAEPYLSPDPEKRLTNLPPNVDQDTFIIPPESYWVMGDNRMNSADSRSCFYNCTSQDPNPHFISRRHIVGRVFIDFGYLHLFADNPGGFIPFKLGSLTWIYPPRLFSSPSGAEYPELSQSGYIFTSGSTISLTTGTGGA